MSNCVRARFKMSLSSHMEAKQTQIRLSYYNLQRNLHLVAHVSNHINSFIIDKMLISNEYTPPHTATTRSTSLGITKPKP